MRLHILGLALLSFMLLGCASSQPEMVAGHLGIEEMQRINLERQRIVKACQSEHSPLESGAWDCLRDLIPITALMGPEFSDSWSHYLRANRLIARSFERGAISERLALDRMSRNVGQLELELRLLEGKTGRKRSS